MCQQSRHAQALTHHVALPAMVLLILAGNITAAAAAAAFSDFQETERAAI